MKRSEYLWNVKPGIATCSQSECLTQTIKRQGVSGRRAINFFIKGCPHCSGSVLEFGQPVSAVVSIITQSIRVVADLHRNFIPGPLESAMKCSGTR